MRKLPPDEVASVFQERDATAARERERGSGLSPDLEALAARVFGGAGAPDLGDSLERLTVALATLREAFVPAAPNVGRLGREVFLAALERIAAAAGPVPPPAAIRGDLSEVAPDLLANPRFWLGLSAIRAEALAGDDSSARLLESVLDLLRVRKARSAAGRANAEAERDEAARELLGDPDFRAIPTGALAVEIARDGTRGPVPLRAAELFVNALPDLARILRLEAERKRTPDPARRRAMREEAERLREALAARALTLEGRRLRTAKRKRAKTRGPK